MSEVFFFVAAIAVFAGAIGVIMPWTPFYNVLALVVHLFGLAAMFLLLRAQFVAAAQIVVYAGAVMVLYVFVVAYVGGQDERLGGTAGRGSTALAALFAGALLVELCIAVLGSGLQALDTEGAGFNASDPNGFGSPSYIGRLLLTKFLFPFEAASILLLVAAVGAVVLARRRGAGSTLDDTRITFAQVLQPPGTGSMAEAASGRVGTPALEAETSEGMGEAKPERDTVEAGW
jgi:NADH:ubiquinone oxidoreductase subunit 6 (subunit J)